MKIKYLLLIFIFLILDISIFFYFKGENFNFRSLFWIYHFLLTLVFIYLNDKIINRKQFDIFIILFPVIGYIMIFFDQFLFFKDYFKSEIEVNEGLEKYILNEEKDIIVNSSIDLNLIGAYDILAVGTPKEKKNFLIGFETSDLKFKIDVLKKALWDKDIEVIHYAATEINKIDEKFQMLIKEKISLNEIEEVEQIYFEYCASGLLEGEILEFYQKKVIDIVLSKKELNIWDRYKILIIYKNMKKYEKCEEIIKKIMKDRVDNEEIINYIEKYFYDLNNYKKLEEVKEWRKSV